MIVVAIIMLNSSSSNNKHIIIIIITIVVVVVVVVVVVGFAVFGLWLRAPSSLRGAQPLKGGYRIKNDSADLSTGSQGPAHRSAMPQPTGVAFEVRETL